MAIIIGVLEEEYERLLNMKKTYEKKINDLPKGTLRIKKINGHPYYYLAYREGKMIKTMYVRNSDKVIEDLKFKMAQRNQLQQEMKEIEKDLRIIRKVLKR